MQKIKQELPVWSMDDIYTSITSPKLYQDISSLQDRIDSFVATYHDDKKKADPEKNTGKYFYQRLKEYEFIEQRLSYFQNFAMLNFTVHMHDSSMAKFYQDITELCNDLSSRYLAFTLSLSNISLRQWKNYIADEARLEPYAYYFQGLRETKQHQFNEKMEKYCLQKDHASRDMFIRIYDDTLSRMKFPFDGKLVGEGEILHELGNNEQKKRQEAAHSLGRELKRSNYIFTSVYNALIRNYYIDYKERGYKTPIQVRHKQNRIEDQEVTCLINTAKKYYAPVSHRYYKIKAQLLKQNHLAYWDRLAPLPFKANKQYSFCEAKKIILDAFGSFDSKMADIAKIFFDRQWIDAAPKDGKDAGAFSHPMTSDYHPMVLINYRGSSDCIMTLAHELGHGIHQYLAYEQPYLLSDTPLTLAETASIFAERLTFEHLYHHAQDKEEKALLLGKQIEDSVNTVMRQIAFVDFEIRCHDKRVYGEIGEDDFAKIWNAVNRESLGPIFQFDDYFNDYWCYISHFFHTPFYVYSYAFGYALVNNLYVYYQNLPQQKHEDFIHYYRYMLSQGGAKNHNDLLKPLHLDTRKDSFWEGCFVSMEQSVNDFEKLLK